MSLAESGDRLDFEFDSVSASGVRKRSKHSIALFDPSLHGEDICASRESCALKAAFSADQATPSSNVKMCIWICRRRG